MWEARSQVFGHLLPVAAAGVAEGVPDQVQDAGLHQGLRPHGVDRCGQPGQAVTDHDADIAHAAVLDLGEDLQPVLRAFPPSPAQIPNTTRRPSMVTLMTT